MDSESLREGIGGGNVVVVVVVVVARFGSRVGSPFLVALPRGDLSTLEFNFTPTGASMQTKKALTQHAN